MLPPFNGIANTRKRPAPPPPAGAELPSLRSVKVLDRLRERLQLLKEVQRWQR